MPLLRLLIVLTEKNYPNIFGKKVRQKIIEVVRLLLAEALYHKGLALAEIESLKADLFEENFKELRKWADVSSSRYGLLSVICERRRGKLRTALKILDRISRDEEHPPKKKLRELRLSLQNEIG